MEPQTAQALDEGLAPCIPRAMLTGELVSDLDRTELGEERSARSASEPAFLDGR